MRAENSMRENLFSAEPLSPERQQRFRQELAQILEPRLPRSHRLYYMFCLVCLVIGLPGAACGFFLDPEHSWLWGLNLLALIPLAGWMLYILRRGAEPLQTMQGMSKAFVGISWAVALLCISLVLQSPSLAGVLWALLALLFFLLTNFINIWNRLITAERSVREHTLRVEYRLADLAARLPTSTTPRD
jgi:4-amino-4-deoxy-L-arabinose transferase-like glycosyltransferase